MNNVDPLSHAVTQLRAARDAIGSAGVRVRCEPYQPSGSHLNRFASLTQGTVTQADLDESRAIVDKLVGRIPKREAILELPASDQATVTTYIDSLTAVAALLESRKPGQFPLAPLPVSVPAKRDRSRPPLPETLADCALARMSVVSPRMLHHACEFRGFVKVEQNPWHQRLARALGLDGDRTTYVHPDGCWASVVLYEGGAEVEVGWKGYELGELGDLYQRGRWH
jgi:hypothetical protein